VKIKQKILLSFLFVSILVLIVGFIGLYANNVVIDSFKKGEERFGPILSSSNDLSGYAKRAEGHTFLYLTLNNKSDRKKAFDRIGSLREELKILEGNTTNPDAISLLNTTKTKTDEMQSIIEELFKLHDTEMEKNGTFDFTRHETLIRNLDDVSAEIRMNGLEFGDIEIGLHQEHNSETEDNASFLNEIIFMIFGLTSFSVIILGFIFDKNISIPLDKLKDAAIEVGRGNLDTRINIQSNDEIGILSNEFNNMSSNLKISGEQTRESEKRYHELFNNMLNGSSYCKMLFENEKPQDFIFIEVNKAFEKLTGLKNVIGKKVTEVIPGFRESYPEIFESYGRVAMTGSMEWFEIYLDQIGWLDISLFSNEKGYFIAIFDNITLRKVNEKKIRQSLEEKKVLLREIHHRVKNNMQIVSSLLMLQSQNIEDKKYKNVFIDSQNRIQAMALIHQKLYQSDNLAEINFKEYIDGISSNIMESYGQKSNIKIDINIENVPINLDYAVPCGLIINELVTNSFKYAFPEGRQGIIKISAKSNENNMIQLSISDDGIGIPKDMDIRNTESLGLKLVTGLAEGQLHGELILNRESGTEFQINFRGTKC
jgi:PAS domain S-box-containing protein